MPIKNYYLNGQTIAMRRDGVLTYLHPDHLGSTAMSTDANGYVTVNQGYYAYGRYRSGGTLPTDRRHTGQQRDDTGLYYYNARYYDPLLGTFLSPDTLVPDPSNVQAYNRYLYALGNPLKYNDPSGNCVANEDGSPDLENDGGCWAAADEWLKTFGSSGYASDDDWRKLFASNADITEKILRNGLYAYWNPIYQQSGTYHPLYNPPPVPNEPGAYPPCCASPIGNAIGNAVQTACSDEWWDCPGIALDAASTGLSFAGDSAILCTVAVPGCGAVAVEAKKLDAAVTVSSAMYAASQYASGDASDLDAAIATADTLMSTVPVFGEVTGVGSLIWDFADPFVPDERWFGPGIAR